MSEGDREAGKNAASQTEVTRADPERIADSRQRELGFPAELRELISVERERIESANRRTEVARYAIEMNDASDKRQFDFQMEQLSSHGSDAKRRYKFAVGVAIAGFSFTTVLAVLLLGMAFWGTPQQAEMAFAILKALGLGVAGYGIIGAATRAVRALMNHVGKST